MKYRKVGKSGLKISEISLGSWLTYGNQIGKDIAFKIFEAAIDNGINFIDSAEIYAKGKAESVIGEFIAQETIDRDDLVLSSKVFWPMNENINRWGLSRKNIINSINGTLERLNTDYVDIYYMHRYDYKTPLKETVQIINDLIRQGKIRYWGTSVWTAAQLERVNAVCKELNAPAPIVEQPLYNMLYRHIELEIMGVAKTHGTGFTVWSPLAQGLLTGKYNDGIPENSRVKYAKTLEGSITDENLSKVRKLSTLASELDIKVNQLALAWILRKKQISSAITGATKPQHIIENAQASDVQLSNDTLEQIEKILDNKPEWSGPYKPNIYYQEKMR